MNAANDGGPAFPVQALASPGSEVAWGMSLRDWFAGQETLADLDSPEASVPKWAAEALAGRKTDLSHVTKADNWIEHLKWEAEWRSALKYIRADAMLRARERGQEGEQGGEKMPIEELPDEHWHKIQTRPSLSWHPARGWEAACELRGKMMYGRGKTIAQAQANLRAEWEGGGQ